MGRKRSTPPKDLGHRWYLAEWAERHGKKQADAMRELGWSKTSASYLWTGRQRYTQDLVDDVARWFVIDPYEVLMPPDLALALRGLRTAAEQIVDSLRQTPAVAAAPVVPQVRRTGTRG